jgi:hypothetical protein
MTQLMTQLRLRNTTRAAHHRDVARVLLLLTGMAAGIAVAPSTGCILSLKDVDPVDHPCTIDDDCGDLDALACIAGACARRDGGEGEGEGEEGEGEGEEGEGEEGEGEGGEGEGEPCVLIPPECDGPVTCVPDDANGQGELACNDIAIAQCAFGCRNEVACEGVGRSLVDVAPGLLDVAVGDLVLGDVNAEQDVDVNVHIDGATVTLSIDGDEIEDPFCALGIQLVIVESDEVSEGGRPFALLRARRIELLPRTTLTVTSEGLCGGLALLADTDMIVHDGALIDLAADGATPGCGGYAGGALNQPGEAPQGMRPAALGSGGSHATRGRGLLSGEVFGNLQLTPIEGGGGGGGGSSTSGGGGGGALYLAAQRELVLHGTIDVRGASGGGVDSGAGAGGAVLIEAGSAFVNDLGFIDIPGGPGDVKIRGGDGGADGQQGSGRLRFRNRSGINPQPGDNFVDVELANDVERCETLVEVDLPSLPAGAQNRAPQPLRLEALSVVDEGGDVLEGALLPYSPASLLASNDDFAVIATNDDAAILSDGGAVIDIEPGFTNIDAVAIDDVIALAAGAEIRTFGRDGAFIASITDAARTVGAPIAVAGETIAYLGSDGAVHVRAQGDAQIVDVADADVLVSLSGNDDVFVVGGFFENIFLEDEGMVAVLRNNAVFAVADGETNFGFRDFPTALGVAGADAGRRIIAAGAPLDDACGIPAGQLNDSGAVVVRFSTGSVAFPEFAPAFYPYDPARDGVFGRSVAVFNDRIAVGSETGPLVLRQSDPDFFVEVITTGDPIVAVPAAQVALAFNLLLFTDNDGDLFVVDLP